MDYADQFPESFAHWKKTSNSIICLAADDEAHLQREYARAAKLGADVAKFLEPDVDDQWTSIAFYADAETRKKFRHLGIVGKKEGALNKHATEAKLVEPLPV